MAKKGSRKKDWFVYIIETESGLLYTGITKDLARRLLEHQSQKKGAKFFRTSPPKEMLFSVGSLTHSKALKLEYAIKQLTRAEKLELIQSPLTCLPVCR